MSQELIISTADLAITLTDLKTQAEDLLQQGQRAVIDSLKSDENGTDYMKVVGGIEKRLDQKRLSLVEAYSQRVRYINAQFKPVKDILIQGKELVRSKKTAYFNIQQRKLREEQAEQRRKSEEAALEAAQQAEEAGDAATSEAILNMAAETPEPEAKPQIARGELTGAATVATKVWTARVDNIKHVCQAIADGRLPEDLVEFPKSKLNALARDWHEKSPDAEEIGQYGILVSGENRISVR